MPKTEIHCRHNTAGLFLLLIGSALVIIGCESLYHTIGLTDEQTAQQLAADQEALQGLLTTGRTTLYDIIVTIMAGGGTILSGLLAKWLGTERKITTAMIQGIESADPGTVKEEVQKKAIAAGVESKLHSRVVALT